MSDHLEHIVHRFEMARQNKTKESSQGDMQIIVQRLDNDLLSVKIKSNNLELHVISVGMIIIINKID